LQPAPYIDALSWSFGAVEKMRVKAFKNPNISKAWLRGRANIGMDVYVML
jgi:hypothetical protein